MTVKELIEELKDLNPEAEIAISKGCTWEDDIYLARLNTEAEIYVLAPNF